MTSSKRPGTKAARSDQRPNGRTLLEHKMHSKNPQHAKQPQLLLAAEKAAMPTTPKINWWHGLKLDFNTSAMAARKKEEVIGDLMDSGASIIKMQTWTDTNIRLQEIFCDYANRIKELTPHVVNGAVAVNSAIEAARPLGYEVLDRAQKEAKEIIERSLQAGDVSKEIAERRKGAVTLAHADDERFFDNLILGAKVANRNIAFEAVNRVASVFERSAPPVIGRVIDHE